MGQSDIKAASKGYAHSQRGALPPPHFKGRKESKLPAEGGQENTRGCSCQPRECCSCLSSHHGGWHMGSLPVCPGSSLEGLACLWLGGHRDLRRTMEWGGDRVIPYLEIQILPRVWAFQVVGRASATVSASNSIPPPR